MNDFSPETPQPTDLIMGSDSPFGISLVEDSQRELGQIFLGNTGQGKFKDKANIPLAEEGLDLEVFQNSAGFTGIRAKQHEGFKVESFKVDKESGTPSWEGSNDEGRVNVVFDRGNMHKENPSGKMLAQHQLGNPGWKVGVVRVTKEATGETDYYALGAKFTGQADKWNVLPAVARVALADATIGNSSQPLIESAKE